MKYLTKYLKRLKQFRTLTKQDEIQNSLELNPEVDGLYEIVSLPDKPEAWCVKLIGGEFSGLIYTYAKLDLQPNKLTRVLNIKIEYDILWVPETLRKKEMPDEKKLEFETMLGKIAMNILYKNTENLEEDSEKLVLKNVK